MSSLLDLVIKENIQLLQWQGQYLQEKYYREQ